MTQKFGSFSSLRSGFVSLRLGLDIVVLPTWFCKKKASVEQLIKYNLSKHNYIDIKIWSDFQGNMSHVDRINHSILKSEVAQPKCEE